MPAGAEIVQIMLGRTRQQVVRLNPPFTIIQPEAMLRDMVRGLNPLAGRRFYTLVYEEHGRVAAYIQTRCRWQRRDEWTVTT